MVIYQQNSSLQQHALLSTSTGYFCGTEEEFGLYLSLRMYMW